MNKLQRLLLVSQMIIIISGNSSAQIFWNTGGVFSGNANSYATRGSSASLNITGSFTLESWLKPVSVSGSRIIIQKREGGDPVGYTLYLTDGKVTIRTNSNTRLTGKTILQTNTWTHVAGTYNSSSGLFSVYINGALDTSVTIAGAAPLTNPDSLYIGKGFNNPFNGQMDEVRIWNRSLSAGEIISNYRLSLGTNTGVYNGLVLSLTFQKSNSDGTVFTLNDNSGNSNHLINRGVSAADFSDQPSQTIDLNSSVELSGFNQYLAAPDDASFSPVNKITLEAWIFPRTFGTDNIIIHKGPDNGSAVNYSLKLHEGKLQAILNNSLVLASVDEIPLNQWSHAAFTFDALTDIISLYLNGKLIDNGINNSNSITNGTDSIYIGGTMALQDFDGYIDEVRIKSEYKSAEEINSYMFRSIDESNDLAGPEAVFNFDGFTESGVGALNKLHFRNNGNFSYSSSLNNTPVSPLIRADGMNFSEGFYVRSTDLRIPQSGTSGYMISDTLNIAWNEVINDINVFVALNHTSEQNLSVTLVSPFEESLELYSSHSLTANHDNLVTIFDDQANSSVTSSSLISFSPSVKPFNELNSKYAGNNTIGKWKLIINDIAPGDTGRLYGWGIQINNRSSLQSAITSYSLIQGFYNPSLNEMVRDTVQLNVRSSVPPFEIVDSSKRKLGDKGFGVFPLNNIVGGISYYLQLKHRNSIETWSSAPVMIDPLTLNAEYDFRTSASKAFGNNLANVDTSPEWFAVYNGDVNQDGVIDLFDVIMIFNDANIFTAGYVVTDVNGDNVSDLTDVILTYNNSMEFISVQEP